MDTQASSSHPQKSLVADEELYLANSKFESSEALLKSARSFYYDRGYGISTRSSKPNKCIILQCSRGGSYRDRLGIKDKRKKKTVSILIDCPFRIEGQRISDGSWIFKSHNLNHNHEPSTDMSGHPSFRQLSSEEIQTVKEMSLAGIPPRQILSSLRQKNPNLPAISRTLYNLKKQFRKDNLGNRSLIGALFEELAKCGYTYDIIYNSEGRITRLFIVHPLSIKLAKVFSNTFVMDCTYKTNRYNMPLLDIIGVSCFNSSFYSGFAFLEKEDEENYVWALDVFKKILGQGNQPSVIMTDRELALMNAIRSVFPSATNLLCVWHIEKNVLANCKKHFNRAEDFDNFMLGWKNVVYSMTEDLLATNWHEFEMVEQKISLAVKHEFNEIKVQIASEKIQVPHNCNMPIFRELLGRVSRFALEKIYQQYKKVEGGTLVPCTKHFMLTMGLPCAHKIAACQGTTITLDLIHPQWRIDTLFLNSGIESQNDDENKFSEILKELNVRYKTWPISKKEHATAMITQFLNECDTFFEPVIQRPKGRPPKHKKRKGVTSTAREPSRFEYVESTRTQNPSSSARKEDEVAEQISYVHLGDNSIDLNAYPYIQGQEADLDFW